MNTSLVILFNLGAILLQVARIESAATSSCQDMTLHAGKNYKQFASPNFPNKFAKQTQCNWIVKAPPGYRVELGFVSFYLLGGFGRSCQIQHVKFLDRFSGILDGPYCGNTPPPQVVTTGSTIRVTLESNAVGISQFYNGFQIRYRATRKRSSERLRDAAGRWRDYHVIGGDERIPITTTTTTTTTISPSPTRSGNDVDNNNNAAIDAVNNEANIRNNQHNNEANIRNNQHNDVINQQNNAINLHPMPDSFPPDTTAPRRPPSRSPPRPTPPRIRHLSPTRLNKVPLSTNAFDDGNADKSEKPNAGLSPGAIAAIVVVVVAVLIVAIITSYKFCLLRKNSDEEAPDHRERRKIENKNKKKGKERSRSRHRSDRHDEQHMSKHHKQSKLPGTVETEGTEHRHHRPHRHHHKTTHNQHRKHHSRKS